jgi:hypothetical protein
VNGGVIRDLEVREIARPSGVGGRDAVGEQEGAQDGVEPLGKADGLMMSSCRGLELDAEGGVGGSYDAGDEDGATIGADAASEALIASHIEEVEVEDLLGGGGALYRNRDHTTRELVCEDESVVVTVVVEADSVEVNGDDVPGVVAVAGEVEGTSRDTTDLGAQADVAATEVAGDVGREQGPVVEA